MISSLNKLVAQGLILKTKYQTLQKNPKKYHFWLSLEQSKNISSLKHLEATATWAKKWMYQFEIDKQLQS